MKQPKISIPSFRCFNIETKEVIYSYKGCNPDVAFVSTAKTWGFYPVSVKGIEVSICLGNPQNSVLSKGSGITDINGNEIFQYDIVKDLSSSFSVGFEKLSLCGEVYIKDGVFRESYFNQPISFYMNLEVIGDRFEDPDLLEHCPPIPKGHCEYEG